MVSHPFVFRPGTLDEEIFRVVALDNEYRLPDSFEARAVVLDIGCHIGSFCYAALERGAAFVLGFEANVENYRRARQNLQSFGARVRIENKAVWRSDRPVKTLTFTECPENNGGGSVWRSGPGPAVPAAAFDDVIRAAARVGRGRVRLVKIDCEGSEFPILLTSKTLHMIDEIVGEFHEFGPEDVSHESTISPEAAVAGHDRFTMKVLASALGDAGFAVETVYHPAYPRERLGWWFARRDLQRAPDHDAEGTRWQALRRRVARLAS